MAFNNKVLFAIVAVAIVVIGGVAIVVMNNNGNSNSSSVDPDKNVPVSDTGYARLAILGNADMNDTLDSKDVDYLKDVINGKKDANKYCNLNGDSIIDSKDLEILQNVIAGKATSLGYINVKGESCSVTVPIKNVAIGFRRTSEMVGFLAGSDIISAMTVGTLNQFSFVGFTDAAKENIINPGQNNDSNVSSEQLLTIYKKFQNNGGLTIIGDSNGMDSKMESYAGELMDVVRLPCTEGTRINEGMVTLAYMLAYNSDNAASINERLNYWITLSDKTDSTITAAVAKLTESEKTKGLIALNNLTTAGGGTYNIRGEGLSEYEFTVMCGCNNISQLYISGAYTSFTNEALMALQQAGLTNMVVEIQTLFQKITKAYESATTDEEKQKALNLIDELVKTAKSDSVLDGYTGDMYFVGQETCNGPESIFVKMYLASIYVPELKDTYSVDNINAMFKEYMTMLNPDSYMKDAKIFA